VIEAQLRQATNKASRRQLVVRLVPAVKIARLFVRVVGDTGLNAKAWLRHERGACGHGARRVAAEGSDRHGESAQWSIEEKKQGKSHADRTRLLTAVTSSARAAPLFNS
jgi:hypothetical protein